MKRLVILGFFVFLLSGCGQQAKEAARENASRQPEVAVSQEPIRGGQMLPRVHCSSQPSYSYALYVPKSYRATRAYPALLLFDAHGRGSLPVKKYRQLAEDFQLVIACSNDSKNGLKPTEINRISYHYVSDVAQRIRIAENGLFLGGFSGGARIASQVAMQDKQVKGVIACGAGLPTEELISRLSYRYFITAGDEDFNYRELKELAMKLEQQHKEFIFERYAGRHDWAPTEVVKTALFYFLINETAQGQQKDSLVKAYKAFEKQKLQAAQNTNDIIAQAAIYERMSKILNAEENTLHYQKRLQTLYGTKQWYEHRKHERTALAMEALYQQELRRDMADKPLSWWKKKLDYLHHNIAEAPYPEEAQMNKRLLNYLSLVAYLYCDNALKTNNLQDAQKYLYLYEQVDADNSEVYYLKGVFYAMQNRQALALKALQEAVSHGFTDFDRLMRDRHFHFSAEELELIKMGAGRP